MPPDTPESPTPEPPPEWLDVTPGEPRYVLQMQGPDGQPQQSIPLARSEYLDLKKMLADFRGHRRIPLGGAAAAVVLWGLRFYVVAAAVGAMGTMTTLQHAGRLPASLWLIWAPAWAPLTVWALWRLVKKGLIRWKP